MDFTAEVVVVEEEDAALKQQNRRIITDDDSIILLLFRGRAFFFRPFYILSIRDRGRGGQKGKGEPFLF